MERTAKQQQAAQAMDKAYSEYNANPTPENRERQQEAGKKFVESLKG